MGCLLKGGGGLNPRLVVGAVLLAAGEARRMGGRPKVLLELGGVPLIRRCLIALSGAGVDEVAVVLGHRAGEIEAAVRDFPITLARNPDYAAGRAGSVRCGLAALSGKLDAVIVAVADQPLLNASDVTALIGAYKKRGAAGAVVPFVAGARGNPVMFDNAVREEILSGAADFGCRQWSEAHAGRIARFETDNRHYVVDLDSPEDLERFSATYGHALRWPAESTA
jgi:molybdenum cofactor cytidylyltransferase